MVSRIDTMGESADDHGDGADPVGTHLHSALESRDDDVARYHLREALQLQIAELHEG